MRKQTDVVIRVLPLANRDEGMAMMTTETASRLLREMYLANGYEVLSANVAQISGGGIINICYTIVKYEEVPDVAKSK